MSCTILGEIQRTRLAVKGEPMPFDKEVADKVAQAVISSVK